MQLQRFSGYIPLRVFGAVYWGFSSTTIERTSGFSMQSVSIEFHVEIPCFTLNMTIIKGMNFPFQAKTVIVWLLFFMRQTNLCHSSWRKIVEKEGKKKKSLQKVRWWSALLLHQWLDSKATHSAYQTVCISAIKISKTSEGTQRQAALARKRV